VHSIADTSLHRAYRADTTATQAWAELFNVANLLDRPFGEISQVLACSGAYIGIRQGLDAGTAETSMRVCSDSEATATPCHGRGVPGMRRLYRAVCYVVPKYRLVQGLDAHGRALVLCVLNGIGEHTNVSIVYVSHHQDESLENATHMMEMEHGRYVCHLCNSSAYTPHTDRTFTVRVSFSQTSCLRACRHVS
jgi:hypothetical protein